jgi:hypothetical protein
MATSTLAEYVTLTAFPLQKWLRKRASMLGYNILPFLLLESFQMTAEIITSQVFVLVLTYSQFIQNLHYRYGKMEVASRCVTTDH